MLRKLQHKFFAMPEENVIGTTPEALAKNPPEKNLKYIMAHEISHIIVDRKSVAGLTRATALLSVGLLAAFTVISILPTASILAAGVSVPKALIGLWLTSKAAKLCNNYAVRAMENRADRNAMYITRDFNSAAATLISFQKDPPKKKPSWLVEIRKTHPTCIRRIEALKKSWEMAITYPAIAPGEKTNDNALQPPAALKELNLGA